MKATVRIHAPTGRHAKDHSIEVEIHETGNRNGRLLFYLLRLVVSALAVPAILYLLG